MRKTRLILAAAFLASAVAPAAASAGFCTLREYQQPTPAGSVTLVRCVW